MSAQALDALWLCIAEVWPMAKPQSRSFSAQNENISGFAIWYPLLVCCFRLADIAGCRLSAMSDVERPKPELYREAAERLRQLAGEIRLPDIRADLLDLSARFERMAAYYAAQITNLRRSPRSK
jgi:hypothetical protein